MISRAHRFHGYGSLKFVYQNGKTIRGPIIALKYSANPRRSTYRMAVVVSKKVNKSAVVRNRIRRRIYEAVRRYEANITDPFDIVCTVFHEQILELSPDQLDTMVHAQLVQAGIITKAKPAI